MTFAELLIEVYTITGRADLVDLTKLAIKSATLKAHQTDFYAKDLYEAQFNFVSAEYIQSFVYFSFIPNYRALKYARKFNTSDSTAGDFFTLITPEELLDEWNRERTDVCYVAGSTLSLKSSTEFDSMILSAYVSPIVVEANYSSWVAALYPYAIIHEAARLVYTSTGQDAEKRSQMDLVAEQYAELKINATVEQGY